MYLLHNSTQKNNLASYFNIFRIIQQASSICVCFHFVNFSRCSLHSVFFNKNQYLLSHSFNYSTHFMLSGGYKMKFIDYNRAEHFNVCLTVILNLERKPLFYYEIKIFVVLPFFYFFQKEYWNKNPSIDAFVDAGVIFATVKVIYTSLKFTIPVHWINQAHLQCIAL